MNYVYTQIEIQPPGWEPSGVTQRGYVFDIVAENSAKLEEAIRDAEGLVGIWEMGEQEGPWEERRPSYAEEIKWTGEQEVSEDDLEDLIWRVDEYMSPSHLDRVFEDLGRKGWAFIVMP